MYYLCQLQSQKYYNELFYGAATAGMRYMPHYNIVGFDNKEVKTTYKA